MVLLVANSRDFATDYVVAQLIRRGAPYYRLDLDLLEADSVSLDPVGRQLSVRGEPGDVTITPQSLSGILFRAPTYLRESSSGRWSSEELLQRHQWAAFARSLIVLDCPAWINYPPSVYLAECKPYQLCVASRVGFAVPESRVANIAPSPDAPVWDSDAALAVKALDSFLLRVDGEDAFFYTRRITAADAGREAVSAMPLIFQRYLGKKLDLRATVVRDQCFTASVTVDGRGVDGDWRLAKRQAAFAAYDLPPEIRLKCMELTRELGLLYGAIDLALVDGTYYFLEINPTGEWAWLVEATGMRIDEALADALCTKR